MTLVRRIAVLPPLLIAGIVSVWWLDHTPPAGERPIVPIHSSAPQTELVVEESGSLSLAREGKQPLSTPPATPSAATANSGDEPRAAETPPAPLTLALPDMPADTVDRLSWAADVLSQDKPPPRVAFDFTPEEPVTPEVESITLFNPEYGLRGFLKQQWLSQRFGLQGGLGLNDDRLVETGDGLRDDIAVGMGIILTF